MRVEILAVLAPGLLLFAVIGVLAVRSQRYRKALAERAAERGWSWRGPEGRSAWAVEGAADGLPWRVECRRNRRRGSSGGGTVTRFEAPASTPHVVMSGPKLPPMVRGIDLGSPLAQGALRMLFGDDAALLAEARLQPVDGRYGEVFDVLAASEEAAAVLDDEMRAALLQFAEADEPPTVTLWRDQLVVYVRQPVYDPDRLERLVGLGTALLRTLG